MTHEELRARIAAGTMTQALWDTLSPETRRAVRNATELVRAIREWRANPQLLKPRPVVHERRYSANVLNPALSPEWTADDAAELMRRAMRVETWREYGGQGYDLPGTLLRVADGAHCTMTRELVGEIETSRGARFPLEHGVRALPLIRRVADRVGGAILYARNGHTIHLGHYDIDRIERRNDGVHVIAGCHDVPLSEVEHCARVLGL